MQTNSDRDRNDRIGRKAHMTEPAESEGPIGKADDEDHKDVASIYIGFLYVVESGISSHGLSHRSVPFAPANKQAKCNTLRQL